MALSGLKIQKLLPRTNCKECGSNTCLAFAMKLAGEVTVEGGDKTRFSVAFPRDQV